MVAADCSPSNALDPINQFALVSYIPDPLGQFLDEMRLRLDPDSNPHAHVTVLPPRPLCGPADQAIRNLRQISRTFSPFAIDLVEVAKFDVSDVVYLKIGSGRPELRAMYEAMNCGPCEYSERFRYHPHITLAQNIAPEKVKDTLETAVAAWATWTGERKFRVETLSFVQNTSGAQWIDLDRIALLDHSLLAPPTRTDRAGTLHPA